MPVITAHGDPYRAPGKWPYGAEWHCPRCGCRWRLSPTDRADIAGGQRGDDNATCRCPECEYPETMSREEAARQTAYVR